MSAVKTRRLHAVRARTVFRLGLRLLRGRLCITSGNRAAKSAVPRCTRMPALGDGAWTLSVEDLRSTLGIASSELTAVQDVARPCEVNSVSQKAGPVGPRRTEPDGQGREKAKARGSMLDRPRIYSPIGPHVGSKRARSASVLPGVWSFTAGVAQASHAESQTPRHAAARARSLR